MRLQVLHTYAHIPSFQNKCLCERCQNLNNEQAPEHEYLSSYASLRKEEKQNL